MRPCIAPDQATRKVLSITELAGPGREGRTLDHAVVVHPYSQRDLEALARAVHDDSFGKLFVMIWAPKDVVRTSIS